MKTFKIESASDKVENQKNEAVKLEIPFKYDIKDCLQLTGKFHKRVNIENEKKNTKSRSKKAGVEKSEKAVVSLQAVSGLPPQGPRTPSVYVEQPSVELRDLLGRLEDLKDKKKSYILLEGIGRSLPDFKEETTDALGIVLSSKDESMRAALLKGILDSENLSSEDLAGVFDLFQSDQSKDVKKILFDNLDKINSKALDFKELRVFLTSQLKEKDPAQRYQNLLAVCKSKSLTHQQKFGLLVPFFKKEEFPASQYHIIKEIFNLIKEFQEEDGKDKSRVLLAAALSPQKQIAMDGLDVLLNLKSLDDDKKKEILKIVLKFGYEPVVKQAVWHIVNSEYENKDEFIEALKKNKRKSYSEEEITGLFDRASNIDSGLSAFSPEFSSLWERASLDKSFSSLSEDEKRKIIKSIVSKGSQADEILKRMSDDSFSEQVALNLHSKDNAQNLLVNFEDFTRAAGNLSSQAESSLIKVMLLQKRNDIQRVIYEKLPSFGFDRNNLMPILAIGFDSSDKDVQLLAAKNLKKYDLSAKELSYLSYNLPSVRSEEFDKIICDVTFKNLDKLKELPREERSKVLKNLFEKGSSELQVEILNLLEELDISSDDAAAIIRKGLRDSNREVRLAAIRSVGEFHFDNDSEVLGLVGKLRSMGGEAEESEIKAVLGNLFENCHNLNEITKEIIAEMFMNSPSDEIRGKTLVVLSKLELGKADSLAIIREGIKDGEINVKDAALFALKNLGVTLEDISDMIEIIAKMAPRELSVILGMSPAEILRSSVFLKPEIKDKIIDLFYNMEDARPALFEVLDELNLMSDQGRDYIIKGLRDSYTRAKAIRLLDDFAFSDENFVKIIEEIMRDLSPSDVKELSEVLPSAFRNSKLFNPVAPRGVLENLLNSGSSELIKSALKNLPELKINKVQAEPYISRFFDSKDESIRDAAIECYESLKD